VREAELILEDASAHALFISEDLANNPWSLLSASPLIDHVFVPGDADYTALLREEPRVGPQHCEPDDLAWLFYTSGTTGRPKGVMLTHRNLLAMTMCYFTDVDQVSGQDSIVYAAPMSHGAGLYNFAHVLVAAHHVVPESGSFDPAELMALGVVHGRLAMFAAPTMVKRLVDHIAARGGDPFSFKTIVYGGGPMYVADIRRALDVMGNRFVQIYGQGESPMTITALSREHLADVGHARHEARMASVGVAQSLVEVRIAGPDGESLSDGVTGEVLARGETVMKGYWNNPQATQQTLRDGWLFTGDMGSLDADGFLTLRDRSEDVIISGGSNIYPREVDEVLLRHPGVHEVAVVGRPHREWGEEVVAFVVTCSGRTVAVSELDALCLQHIARFKRPRTYRFVADLPKNNYGKVVKTELRTALDKKPQHEQEAGR
jgi:long-chain acyl-CoA synthetase